jgi:hypothetical protein
MSNKNINKNLWEWTFENISREDFFINQTFKVDSFWKCPWCENNTLDLEKRICECWYNLEHDYWKTVEETVDDIIEKTIYALDYKICLCWNKMWIKSVMCKECYWKNKLNWNI